MPLCEFRVPTYKRATLLDRALRSLLAQTEPNWVAYIFDDSPEAEGRSVVRGLGDKRVFYRNNAERLGCAGNLDQAFQTAPYGAAEYACILEDDNWVLPEFLKGNLAVAKSNSVSIILRNQQINAAAGPSIGRAPHPTTRGHIFDEQIYQPLQMRASTFFCEGISNGGLFWHTNIASSLQVGSSVKSSSLQEYCRTLQITEPLFFAREPLAVFSWIEPSTSPRERLSSRLFNRGLQSLRSWLLAKHRFAIIEEAESLAARIGAERVLRLHLLDCLRLHDARFDPRELDQWKAVAKGLAKLALIEDPLKRYWTTVHSEL